MMRMLMMMMMMMWMMMMMMMMMVVKTSSKFETYPQSLLLYHISVKCLDDVSGKLGVLKVG